MKYGTTQWPIASLAAVHQQTLLHLCKTLVVVSCIPFQRLSCIWICLCITFSRLSCMWNCSLHSADYSCGAHCFFSSDFQTRTTIFKLNFLFLTPRLVSCVLALQTKRRGPVRVAVSRWILPLFYLWSQQLYSRLKETLSKEISQVLSILKECSHTHTHTCMHTHPH